MLVSTSNQGGRGSTFYYTRHVKKRFIPHVHCGRSWNTFENGFENGEKTIEWVLLTNLDWNSLFSSANRISPSSAKVTVKYFDWIKFLQIFSEQRKSLLFIRLNNILLRGSPPERLDFVWEQFEFMSTFLTKLAAQWNIQFPNICWLKRCNLQFTTWSVVGFCFFALPRDHLCVLQLTMKDTNLVLWFVCLFVCLGEPPHHPWFYLTNMSSPFLRGEYWVLRDRETQYFEESCQR